MARRPSTLTSPLSLLLLGLSALLAPVTALNATSNTDFFWYPALGVDIPTFKVGDKVNVSWTTDYISLNINVWCGISGGLTASYQSLPATPSYTTLTVGPTWNDPCHMTFFSLNASAEGLAKFEKYFTSGSFNVDPVRRDSTMGEKTWSQKDGDEVFAARVSKSLSTASAAPSATGGGSNANGGEQKSSSTPSFGAGIGIGIAISLVPLLIALVAFLLISRRRKSRSAPHQANGARYSTSGAAPPYGSSERYAYEKAPPAELGQEARPSELPAGVEIAEERREGGGGPPRV